MKRPACFGKNPGISSKFRTWSYFDLFSDVCSGIGRRNHDPHIPEGWFRRVGASRRGRRRGSCRCSRSGVEDPTAGNARRNSGTVEGAGASASLCDLFPLHGGYPVASRCTAQRCTRDVHLRCLSKCRSLLSSTPRVAILGQARAIFFLRYLCWISTTGTYVRSDNTYVTKIVHMVYWTE